MLAHFSARVSRATLVMALLALLATSATTMSAGIGDAGSRGPRHDVRALGLQGMVLDEHFQPSPPTPPGKAANAGGQGDKAAGGQGDKTQNVANGWRSLTRGSARGEFSLQALSPPLARHAQQVAFLDGQGEVGIEHRASRGQGLVLVAGKPYEGCLWVRSDRPTAVFVAAESGQSEILTETKLDVREGEWQALRFVLSPGRSAETGRLAVKLKSPGRIWLSHVAFQPAEWAWPETLARAGLPPIAFVTRQPLSRPPAVGQDLWASQPLGPGCSIRVFDPTRPDQPAQTIFSDPDGSIYDMNGSYDARTLFYSYRGKGEQYWHIWRINVDGSQRKQLTDGPYYDVSPCLLPEGDLLFVSTRRFGYTVCQPGPSSNLHRMSPDGGNIRCVSMNTLSDLSPQMLPDGRVLFTRWEYVDRDLTYRQSLWTQYSDGTAYQLYFGNTIRDVGTFWQARPLPGRSDRLVATFAPHHGWPHGAIGLIDRGFGLEGPKGTGFVYITHDTPAIGDSGQEWAYRDPFPLSDHTMLCSYGGGGADRYRLFLLDVDDRKRLIYEDPLAGCYFPLPLRPTPVPATIPARVAAAAAPSSTADQPLGTFLLADVYRGLEPMIQRGRVKTLRVMEQVRKSEDLRSRAFDQSPVMGYGTYYVKRCWGTVPVEEDGSAYFQAPALREIYFQVLDAEGRELQRMTSGVQAMPGEKIACVGCHEPRRSSPRAAGRMPLAVRRPPKELQKPAWGNDGIVAFPTLVQPVLDKYCVRCHRGANPDGGYDLTGDKTRYFNMAYDNLLGRSRSYRQHNMDTGEMLDSERAKGKPLVHFYWLLRTPTGVNQPLWTGCYASRLLDYVDSEHCGQKIPLEDRQRIYTWIDANVPYYATYAHSRPHSPGRRDLCSDVETGRLSTWYERDFLGVYDRRCASCHGKLEGTTDWGGRFAWINFTSPSLSPALTAHLSKQAGGRGIVKPLNGQVPPIFAATADPDYQAMLKAITAGRDLAFKTPEADMPGFRGVRPEP